MKIQIDNSARGTLQFLLLVLVMAILLTAFFGCTTKKHITETSLTATETALRQKEDSIKVLKEELLLIQSELRQLQYAGIVFDSSRCPKIPMVVINGCNNDSINSIVSMLNGKINEYNNLIGGLNNKVEVLSDGTIRAQGLLKSANYSNEQTKKIVAVWQRKYDSLAEAKEKLESSTRIEYKDREVVKKVSFIPWWVWLICGGFALLFLNKQFGWVKNFKFFGTNS